jgi:hypothetical protein
MDEQNYNQPISDSAEPIVPKPYKIKLFAVVTVLIIIAVGIYFTISKPNQDVVKKTVVDVYEPTVIINFPTISFDKDVDGKIINTIYSTTTNLELGTDPYALEIVYGGDLKKEEKYFVSEDGKYYPTGDYFQKVGNIINGKLDGMELWMKVAGGEMGGDYFDSYLISIGTDKYIQFTDGNGTFSLKQPEYPDKIVYPGTEYILTKGQKEIIHEATTTNKFSIGGIDFLVLNNSCVVVKTIDGRYLNYNFNYPIVNKDEREKIVVLFNEGGLNKESYEYNLVACNYFCSSPTLATIKNEDINSGIYKVAGKTTDGKNVYSYADPLNESYKKMYDDKNTAAYFEVTDGYNNLDDSKYSYEEFLSHNPVLFWQDALGNWIKFTNRLFLPMAEKCKPVIYLYPKSDAKLNVQVTPNGGFTKTIPEYPVGGWNVLATPQGKITDLLTNKSYPYLYWSGIGVNYPVDYNLGWLVPSKDISRFLDEKLALLGMNIKEISDFKEYWVPKLSVNKYYQIYFLGKSQIDQMDPLKIYPINPDTIIRVMLTARGLDQAVELTPQILPETPNRSGFAVVEWGGVLLK